jgi:hypothetical protein
LGSGTIDTTDNKQYEIDLVTGAQRNGSVTLNITSVPLGNPVGDRATYEGFEGTAELKFTADSTGTGVGDVLVSLTFERS